ncbi:NAD(P)/FAD-dependent oxidoreductase [Methanoculleus sp. FWC-SCC3]|uniref:NAD(P)/FAD-dependent oxidoreductase n=1 Tax=Methanoculleus methanifontis TaxID=2584086 RepID=A0ABT8M4I5_9EURY|nr:NAD(P)/FAD-dependent oxidoreductase [Methanoculleus sp. FWC-SCC3]MDN7013507.1 NAD(P)/FAD-dependent oxidoreductase [Methanoculleus sp. FWC-SCC3]
MQNRCDVVVVGAGPAGSTAARYAAEAGLDVLLIDKRRVVGVPVCCGEFNASPEVLASTLPNASGLDELFPIDPGLIQRELRAAVAVSPGGREYEFELPGYTVDRDTFDRHLANAAGRAGAVLSPDTAFLGWKGSRVTTTRGETEARVVVAADGPLSHVCRSAGMEQNAVLAPAITCRVDGEFSDRLQFFFGNRIAPGGYAWVFPKRGCANVGLGVQKRGTPLPVLLRAFLASNGFSARDVQAGFVPVSGPIRETVRGNVLAVGDAAGQVVASNGGGIATAMICGRLAGLAAADHLLRGEPLGAYERAWRSAIGRELLAAARMKRMADRVLGSDFLLERTMSLIGGRGIADVIIYGGLRKAHAPRE